MAFKELPIQKMKISSQCLHAGVRPEPVTGAIMTPIFQTSTYVQESPGKHKGYDYSRTKNPTRSALEEAIAVLEGGGSGLAFSSGVAATTTILHLLNSGDHVVAFDDMYGGTYRLFKTFEPMGISFSFIDLRDSASFEKAVTSKTKLLWIETPTNPTMKIADIAALSKTAQKKGIITCVDNTFMTPYFQRPLDLGADIVAHSATKYVNGHSDVVAGLAVTRRKELAERLYFLQNTMGAIPSPMDCFLMLRGMKTLAVRMQAHQKNALEIAQFLEKHPKVEQVVYPGLESHPQHAIAKKQMSGFGGMITAYLKGDLESSRKFLENVSLFSLAESLGGVESLIEHPAIMTHASVPAENRKKLGIRDTMIRLSVGIEDVADLKDDLSRAFAAI